LMRYGVEVFIRSFSLSTLSVPGGGIRNRSLWPLRFLQKVRFWFCWLPVS
jgi:hypothetical protein